MIIAITVLLLIIQMDPRMGKGISLGIIIGIVFVCILCKVFECYGCNKEEINQNRMVIQEPETPPEF